MAPQLFLVLLGCKPADRNTEQHDVFFGIGNSLSDLLPQINNFWPEAKEKLHIDSWRTVSTVNGYQVKIIPRKEALADPQKKLFFLNLGGYKPGDFEEYHYKLLSVAETKAQAIQEAKQTAFYLHVGFAGANSHIDDKYGVDVDDVYEIEDILSPGLKEQFATVIGKDSGETKDDELHVGYLKLSTLA